MAAATYTTQQASHLLSLPAELRNQIYEHVREELHEAVIVSDDGEPTFSDAQHPLSRSCRQLRQEFSSIVLEAAQTCAVIKLRCRNFDMPGAGSMQRFFAHCLHCQVTRIASIFRESSSTTTTLCAISTRSSRTSCTT